MSRAPKNRPRIGRRIARGLPFVIEAARVAADAVSASREGWAATPHDWRDARAAIAWMETWAAWFARTNRGGRS